MKMRIFSPDMDREAAIRPGFDVLMAVSGARQAASPTARRVAATRDGPINPDSAEQRRALLSRGRIEAGSELASVARFADFAPLSAISDEAVEGLAIEINGLFTRAFQSIVKHPPVNGSDNAGYLGGSGSGMK